MMHIRDNQTRRTQEVRPNIPDFKSYLNQIFVSYR